MLGLLLGHLPGIVNREHAIEEQGAYPFAPQDQQEG
jgi:hypothetical protein